MGVVGSVARAVLIWAGARYARFRPHAWIGMAVALFAALAFAYFGYHRIRFVGGCDSASYLAESFRIRGIDVGLTPDRSLGFPDALLPICMVETGGVIHSLFPPGFPLLLAAAGTAQLEFWVTPLLGALSGVALFFMARKRTGDPIAVGVMLAWYAAPMTFWGSTQIMSDYAAASLVSIAVVAASRRMPAVAGLVLGFACGVRPTSALVLPAFTLVLASYSRSAWFRAAAGLAVAGLGWVVFVRLAFGSFAFPYASNLDEMTGERLLDQTIFLLKEIVRQDAPIAVLAALALVRAPRRCVTYVVWFLPFLVVHSLWRHQYVWWWHLRFIASGLPALFLAAAEGAKSISEYLTSSRARMQRIVAALAVSGMAVYGISWARSPEIEFIGSRHYDEWYLLDSMRIKELAPRDALIGAREHTITLRLYGGLQSFRWCHPDAPSLEKAALAQGRPVYAVFMFNDDNGCPEQSDANRVGFAVTDVAVLPSKSRVVRLIPRATPE